MTMPADNDNTGKVLARRPSGKCVVLAITYAADEAEALRRLSSRIVLKGTKHPSMSLLARYGLKLVGDVYARNPEGITRDLGQMVTPVPAPARAGALKRPRRTCGTGQASKPAITAQQ